MGGGGLGLGGKLPYILSDLKRSRKSNQMLSNTILMSTENVKFYQPGPTFPGSIRKSIYRGYIPKNLVPSVRAHEEPGPKCPGSIRKSYDRVYFPKNLVPSGRAHGEPGPKCPGSIRKSFDQGYLPKNLVPSVLARLGSLTTEGIFMRACFQLPWFNQKVLSPSVEKGLNY